MEMKTRLRMSIQMIMKMSRNKYRIQTKEKLRSLCGINDIKLIESTIKYGLIDLGTKTESEYYEHLKLSMKICSTNII